MPLAENYCWGTERPNARIRRLLEKSKPAALTELEKARASLRQAEAAIMAIDAEVQAVEFTIPDGRYDRDRGNALALQGHVHFHASDIGGSERRRRGRPRKYSNDCPPPPRKSRAKTAAGLERAAKGLNRRSARKQRESRETASVSTVTASPARVPVPKLLPEVGRKLLETTIAGSAAIDSLGYEVFDSDAAFYAEEAARELAGKAKAEALIAGAETAVAEAEPQEAEPEPVDEFVSMGPELPQGMKSIRVSGRGFSLSGVEAIEPGWLDEGETRIMSAINIFDHELMYYRRGEDGIACHDYDFSDQLDRSRAKPWMLEMFPMFGLRLSDHLQEPPFQYRRLSDLSNEEAKAWIEASIQLKLSDYYMSYYKRSPQQPKGFLNDQIDLFVEDMWLERNRRRVWPFIQQRLIYVEIFAHRVKIGELSLDHARVLLTRYEIGLLGAMSDAVQDLYYQIVDGMEWFEGFSPRELLHWRGLPEPTIPCRFKLYDRNFRWMYPERLYDAVASLMIEDPAYKVTIPMISNDLVTSGYDLMLWREIMGSDDSADKKRRILGLFGFPEENPVTPDTPRLYLD